MANFYLKWLIKHQFHGIKPGLFRIQKLLKKLGNPHLKFFSIHVAGTNGKGSTCAILSTILTHFGLKTGLYTSPHLIKVEERFKINGEKISEDRLCELLKILYTYSQEPITYFELTTALAFLYFAEEEVDIAVIETGMGGRLDATNVIKPEVSIITTIGLDHTKYLGNTLEDIAFEKAGIIKRERPVVLGNIPQNALKVILDRAELLSSPVFLYNRDFFIYPNEENWNYKGKYSFRNLSLSLKGDYQGHNLALALKTLEILEERNFIQLKEEPLRKALKNVIWEGRYKKIKLSNKEVLLDCAHNSQGIEVLKQSLEKEKFYPYLLILGATNEDGEKPFWQLYEILSPFAEKVYITEFVAERKVVTLTDWKQILKNNIKEVEFFTDPAIALKKALEEKNIERVLITGSIYFIGEILKILQNNYYV
ncbi:MAG: bifunctional folylpolyglutamate synthase/dihydrofolate synthase [Caldimicrobium sp.]